jgi:predicted phage tail protein
MSKARFTQADVSRAVAGAVKAGLAVSGVEITSDGTIRLLAPKSKPDQADERKPKEW